MKPEVLNESLLAGAAFPVEALLAHLEQSPAATIQSAQGPGLSVALQVLARRLDRPMVVVVPETDEARELAEALTFGKGAPSVVFLPPPEVSPYAGVTADRAVMLERVAALQRAANLAPGEILVTCALGWARRSTPAQAFNAASARLEQDGDVELDQLRTILETGGYSSVGLVEDVGTYSIRGDIIDIFAPGQEGPVRIELYGDMVESIRRFDIDSQRGTDELSTFDFGPASEALLNEETRHTLRERLAGLAEELRIPSNRVSAILRDLNEGVRFFGSEALLPGFHPSLESVMERVPARTALVSIEPTRISDTLGRWLETRHAEFERELEAGELHFPISEWMLDLEAHQQQAAAASMRIQVQTLVEDELASSVFQFGSLDNAELVRIRKQKAGGDGAIHALFEIIDGWREHTGRIVFACGGRGAADRLVALLKGYGLDARFVSSPDALDTPRPAPCETIEVVLAGFAKGFRLPALGLAVVSDQELLGREARRRGRAAAHEVTTISSFRELRENDLVVHIDFGVGRYRGLERMGAGGVESDFLTLEYAEGDRLYLPVHRLDRVQKYAGSNTFQRLDKLGGTSWERTRERVKKQLADIAHELLRIHAERAREEGIRFSEPDDNYAEFEAAFPYEETPHQAQAIEDVLRDMMTERPMDRLLCGDVGFGKTEVAIRAAFKAVVDGYQVAVLVPTTVLAEQHGKSFRSRLRHTAARVEVLSRFRTAAEIKEILQDVALGKVDIVIGTHRLLSSDVRFKKLGLLVVDEEQRFGVSHKEKIKKLRATVDVLTMSATPIPRTMEMALLGIRDLSVILTPPPGRQAVRTHVARFAENVVSDAVNAELERGGQVYFVHNRVETIYAVADELRRMVPRARIEVGHAQMSDKELEGVMLRFLNRDIDVLVSTTIIESGIDISSANTMFINDADRFGLSQLHQLRGRIGRSSVRAYCYLLVKDLKRLSDDARRRLEVLQQHTELGAGMQIAQHDLDLRGAGNILGRDQSGHIEAVGFELYSELLGEAVADLQGTPRETEVEPEIQIPVPAYIAEDYVEDVQQRLVFYKRYSMAASEEELFDVHAELQERYGPAPHPVENLRDLVRLKIEMRAIGALKLEAGQKAVVVELSPEPRLNPDKVMALLKESRGDYEFRADMKLLRRLKPAEGSDILAAALRVSRELLSCV